MSAASQLIWIRVADLKVGDRLVGSGVVTQIDRLTAMSGTPLQVGTADTRGESHRILMTGDHRVCIVNPATQN